MSTGCAMSYNDVRIMRESKERAMDFALYRSRAELLKSRDIYLSVYVFPIDFEWCEYVILHTNTFDVK